ncbi:hypothetical protein GCM10022631_42140 [Deinococcus rubellus]|uniref:Uncharacterized protein n=1 Tax=Deinococcus rubellus TaxID=1889240 RepID=A0ABY5YJL9_9DEIO|nr:hypothetical protein [Deinococcus rubellus]UWX65005.1 hypothetical protein N0D28_04925 [Deinococcus rubellus]
MSSFKTFVLLSVLLVGAGTVSAQSEPAPKTPPAASANSSVQSPVTRADLQKFMAVRADEKTALGDSFSSLQTIFDDVRKGNNPSFLQVTGALRQIGGSVGDARAAQKTALGQQNLSSARFRFIRSQINRALGIPSFDLNKVLSKLKGGDFSDLGSTVSTDADPQTKALIEPSRSDLLETAPLGLLGL